MKDPSYGQSYGTAGRDPERFIKSLFRIGEEVYVEIALVYLSAQDFCGGGYVASPRVEVTPIAGLGDWGDDATYRLEPLTSSSVLELYDASKEFAAFRKEFGQDLEEVDFGYFLLADMLAFTMVENGWMSVMGSDHADEYRDEEETYMGQLCNAWRLVSDHRVSPIKVYTGTALTASDPAGCRPRIRETMQPFVRTKLETMDWFLNPNSGNEVRWISFRITETSRYAYDEYCDDEFEEGTSEAYGIDAEDIPTFPLTKAYCTHAEKVAASMLPYITRNLWRNG
jgi:hypothetical protein